MRSHSKRNDRTNGSETSPRINAIVPSKILSRIFFL
jgi:hypothetical protein